MTVGAAQNEKVLPDVWDIVTSTLHQKQKIVHFIVQLAFNCADTEGQHRHSNDHSSTSPQPLICEYLQYCKWKYKKKKKKKKKKKGNGKHLLDWNILSCIHMQHIELVSLNQSAALICCLKWCMGGNGLDSTWLLYLEILLLDFPTTRWL